MENLMVCSNMLLSCLNVVIWQIIIFIGVLWIIKVIIQNLLNKREEAKRQKELDEYCQKRSDFYRREREKVRNYYQEKARQKGELTDEELEDARFYMEINSGDEDGWKKEYENFCRSLGR